MNILKRFITIFIVLFLFVPSSYGEDKIVYLDLPSLDLNEKKKLSDILSETYSFLQKEFDIKKSLFIERLQTANYQDARAILYLLLPKLINNAKNGNTLWIDRLQGAFSGSPIISNDHYYIQSESGTTYVIEPNKKNLRITSKNQLSSDNEEIFRATLSPIDGKIFTRSSNHLYCISSN